MSGMISLATLGIHALYLCEIIVSRLNEPVPYCVPFLTLKVNILLAALDEAAFIRYTLIVEKQ